MDASEHFERGKGVKAKLRRLLDDESVWKEVRSEEGVRVHWTEEREEGGFWLKIVAPFGVEDFEELKDVLDTNLLTRQREWHELLLDGGSVVAVDEERALCHFAYASPWPMSARDCLYAKERVVNEKDEFVLLYWTVRDDKVKPPVPEYVRIDFQAAHWVKRNADSCTYCYIQRSDAKVHLPDFILKNVQVGILFGEVKGLRRAVSKEGK